MQPQVEAARQYPAGTLVAAQELQQHLLAFLTPLLVHLDALLDKRLVRTVFATVQAIMTLRHGTYGLLLSE
jgi:hypothetical protein